ncbi:MAG: DUF2167 domain-containing protein [Verrucomicrobia bacterium]|jgi:uncharacterized membrane-anchored protein|nr:DUF2167 domain-containing protein [Verrucomicrobiota bacterium]
MLNRNSILLAACGLALAVLPLVAQDSKPAKLELLKGPATAKLGAVAQIELPAGFSFLDGKTTRALMKASGEPTSGRELGLLMPTNEHWSVIFEFSDIGYVKDDDKNQLDADKLLMSIKAGTEAANKERARAGNPPLIIVGWERPPKYDETTHNLEWAIRATSDGRPLLNYNTRLLGRKGVMEVVLICEPDQLPKTLPTFQHLLAAHKFQSGESYAEYRSGDKVAKYGLAALVLGGAGVGAAKLGLLGPVILFFKKAWKLLIVAFVAVIGFFKKMFGWLFGRRDEQVPRE